MDERITMEEVRARLNLACKELIHCEDVTEPDDMDSKGLARLQAAAASVRAWSGALGVAMGEEALEVNRKLQADLQKDLEDL